MQRLSASSHAAHPLLCSQLPSYTWYSPAVCPAVAETLKRGSETTHRNVCKLRVVVEELSWQGARQIHAAQPSAAVLAKGYTVRKAGRHAGRRADSPAGGQAGEQAGVGGRAGAPHGPSRRGPGSSPTHSCIRDGKPPSSQLSGKEPAGPQLARSSSMRLEKPAAHSAGRGCPTGPP